MRRLVVRPRGPPVIGGAGNATAKWNKQVNATIADPAFIARVRKELALDQRQAAGIFGGGPNTFPRYENGKTELEATAPCRSRHGISDGIESRHRAATGRERSFSVIPKL